MIIYSQELQSKQILKIPFSPYQYIQNAKNIKFFVAPKIYQYTFMPNGYGPDMHTFIKITNVSFSILARQRPYFCSSC